MTQDEALAIWEYRDGRLYWRENRGKRTKAGDMAGTITRNKSGDKWRRLGHQYKIYEEHRIIFLMHHGYLPEQIDHIDGNGINNDIENLRAATRSQNLQNTGKKKNNKSGFKGVSWHKKSNKWRAQITSDRKDHYLGLFDTPEAAHEAYKAAATKLHKEFARFA